MIPLAGVCDLRRAWALRLSDGIVAKRPDLAPVRAPAVADPTKEHQHP